MRNLLLIFMISVFGLQHAQAQDPPQEAMYELDVQDLNLSEALSRAADIGGFDLAYAPELVVNKTSTCRIRTPSVTALLYCVLEETGLEARKLPSGAFLIQRIPDTAKARHANRTGVILGTVRSDSTRQGIPGAHVLVRGTLLGDATDAEGAYVIERVPEGNYVLVASSIGFQEALREQVQVSPGDTIDVPIDLANRAVEMEALTIVAGYDRFTHRVARSIPVALQSIHVYGVGLGLLVSANPGDVTRFQMSGLGNLAGSDLKGAQVSGLVNYTGGSVYGFQSGGLGNRAGRDLEGLQAGGVFNGVQGDVRGLQAAGVSNTAWATVDGLQAAGVLNVAAGTMRGVQAAGAINLSGHFSGLQTAGAVNVAIGPLNGLQAAGAVNIARSVRGVQVSGAVNVARTVSGMQIGVVNIADKSTGVPLGLFNFVREAGLGFDVWTDETGLVTTVVRSGNRRVSTFLGGAGRPWEDRQRWAIVYGLGLEHDLSRQVFGSIDVISYSMGFLDPDRDNDVYEHLLKLRLMLNTRIGQHLVLFGGPTYNFFTGDDDGSQLAPWTHLDGRIGEQHYRTWPGFVAGLRISTGSL